MRIAWVALWPVLAILGPGLSAAVAESPAPTGPGVELRLSDGTVLFGRIVAENDSVLVVETELLGRLPVERADVERVIELEEMPRRAESAPSRRREEPALRGDPDRNTVMLGPTPETLPAGTGYFRNFELFVLNFGFAPSDFLNLSIGTIFPVSSDLQSLSGGFKLRLISREEHGLGLAVAASGTAIDQERFGSVIGIVGVGDARNSLSLSVHRTFSEGEDVTFFIVGGDVLAGDGFKLLAEYGNSTDAVLSDEDFTGLLNVGFRLFGERTSFSLSGFRPLTRDTGNFIAFPVAMYSRHF